MLIPVRQTIKAQPDPAVAALALSLLAAIGDNPMLIALGCSTQATPVPPTTEQPALASAA